MASNSTPKYKLSVISGTELQLSLLGPQGPAGTATLTIGNTTTSAAGTSASVTNSGTSENAILNFSIPRGDTGDQGDAATITIGNTTTGAAGSSVVVTNTGTSGDAILNFTIPRGDKGNTGTMSVGNVTTGNAGTSAIITNTGTPEAGIFNFTIPRGNTGTAATVTVGNVTTGAAGSSATITNSGNSTDAVFNFTIPRGDKGDKGDTGSTGPTGPTGQSATSFPYLANTGSTSGNPSSQYLLWNNSTQISSTQINVSHISSDGNDYDVFLALLKTSDFIIIQSKTNSDNYQKWQVSSTPTIVSNSYIQIPVTYVSSGGTGAGNFSSNEQLLFLYVSTGATGPAGPANSLSIGTVTAGGIGSASATITGTAPNQTLNLVMPTGATGATGATGTAATIAVGNVTTGSAGSSASVSNTGNSSAAVFDFSIPRGDTGATGPSNNLTVSGTTTGAAGSSASVSISGTSPNQSLAFTIPRGDTGATGATGPTGPQPSITINDNANTSITLSDSDNNTVVRCTSSSAVTITVPSTLATGFSCMVIQAGTGQVTLQAGSGTTLNSFGALLKTAGQHAPASIIRVGSGMYNVSGNLV